MMIVLALVFFLVLGSFGFAVAWQVLHERRLPQALVIAPFLGVGLYVFLVNAVGYLVPIQTAFLAVFLFIAAVGIAFLVRTSRNVPWQALVVWIKKEKRLLIVAGMIMMLTGLMAVRALNYDDLFWGMLPLAQTIRNGNFPVMNPLAPDYPVPYHYGPPLFIAAVNFLAGVPMYVTLDIVTTLAAPLLFLLLFLLLQDMFDARPLAWGGALLGMLGGSLSWVNGVTCGRALFDAYVRHLPVEGPFACAFYMLHGPVATPLFGFLHQHGTPVAAGMVFIILWQCIRYREQTFSLRKKILIGVLGAVFFATIALFHESYLFTLIAGLGAASLCFKINRKWLVPLVIATVVGLVAAYFQGGVLRGHEGVGISMTLNPNPTRVMAWTGPVSIFHWNIGIELAALTLFTIVAVQFAKRCRRLSHLAPFIFSALAAFAVPVLFLPKHVVDPPFINNPAMLTNTARFWTFGMWYILPIVGAALGALILTVRRNIGRLVWVGGFFLILTSILWPLVYIPLYPIAESGWETRRPFVGTPPPPPPEWQEAVLWIQKNTPERTRILTDGMASPAWIMWTGRFFPGITLLSQFYLNHPNMMAKLQSTCDPEAFRFEKIDFVLATDKPVWESRCIANNLVRLVAQDPENHWRIYEAAGR